MSDLIDEFLHNYPCDVYTTSCLLRRCIQNEVPDCGETLHSGWKVVSYGLGYKFCAIAPHNNWVNIQFHNGVALPDPDKLMQGTGKSMRHVKIQDRKDINKSLVQLIHHAVKLAQ